MLGIAHQFNQLKVSPPKPHTVKRIPDGHGCTMIEVQYPTGETRSSIQYDRKLMLALSHSPFSIAQPDDYFNIFMENEDLLPLYPKRYVPLEFMCSKEKVDIEKLTKK